MTTDVHDLDLDHALKSKHRAIWALGDYPAVAAEIIPSLGPILVEACGIGPGQKVLDVAAGTGNASIPAALTGASVIASDLTPELLESGRRLAAQRGVSLEWQEADAEALPYANAQFDTVMSCMGVMFAPHHEASAGELTRVLRPGGTLGLISWTPEGFIGEMFAALRPFAPPLPPGASPAPLWGSADHLRKLLGDRVTQVRAERRTLRIDQFADPTAFREYFKARYGPIVAVCSALSADPERTAELDAALHALAQRHNIAGTSASGRAGFAMDWEYLLFTARRAG